MSTKVQAKKKVTAPKAKRVTTVDLKNQIIGLEAKVGRTETKLVAANNLVNLQKTTIENSVPKVKLDAESLLTKLRWFLDGKEGIWKVVLGILGVVLPLAFSGYGLGELFTFIIEWTGNINNFITTWSTSITTAIGVISGFIVGGKGLQDPRG